MIQEFFLVQHRWQRLNKFKYKHTHIHWMSECDGIWNGIHANRCDFIVPKIMNRIFIAWMKRVWKLMQNPSISFGIRWSCERFISKMNFKCSRVLRHWQGHTKIKGGCWERSKSEKKNTHTLNRFIDSWIDHRKWFVVKYALSNSYANDHFPDYLFLAAHQ